MISYIIYVRLQPPILPRHSALMQTMVGMDMEEDAEILATLLKHIPYCMSAADIKQLLQDIPVQPAVVVPVRRVQEAIAAGDLPPLDVDAAARSDTKGSSPSRLQRG